MVIIPRRYNTCTLLILLLLCSVCIAPVMAADKQSNVVEDGVHLIKLDTSPTKLDPQFYKNMDVSMNFVVDGDHNYWVRIGNEKAKELTVPWWLDFAVVTVFLFPLFFTLIAWYYESKRRFPSYHAKVFSPRPGQSFITGWKNMVVFLIPVILVGLVSMIGVMSGLVPSAFTHAACDGFVDAKASDGTILMKIDKIHPETNPLYMKSGINITKLRHIPSYGNNIQKYGGNPT